MTSDPIAEMSERIDLIENRLDRCIDRLNSLLGETRDSLRNEIGHLQDDLRRLDNRVDRIER